MAALFDSLAALLDAVAALAEIVDAAVDGEGAGAGVEGGETNPLTIGGAEGFQGDVALAEAGFDGWVIGHGRKMSKVRKSEEALR